MELINYKKENSSENPVVLVRNGSKILNGNEVITDLNMTVIRGTMYSLLGCSGCGKSSTLSCILGLDKFTSGTVLLFGEKPKVVVTHLGKNLVGYMPQHYALHEELTILETFNYFGGLNGLTGEMSGGQKRRVSLAISMQHEPELLILDEPTAGVDPLLRQRVWNHLVFLTKSKNVTVLITTHYVEETKHSDVVAIMDNRKLIAEKNPTVLLQQFETTSLEKVVLSLTKSSRNNEIEGDSPFFQDFKISGPIVNKKVSQNSSSLKRIQTLVSKNWRIAMRNKIMFAIALIIPATSLLSVYMGYGLNLNDLNFGVVNEDETCGVPRNLTECELDHLSCRLIEEWRKIFVLARNENGMLDPQTGRIELNENSERLHQFIQCLYRFPIPRDVLTLDLALELFQLSNEYGNAKMKN